METQRRNLQTLREFKGENLLTLRVNNETNKVSFECNGTFGAVAESALEKFKTMPFDEAVNNCLYVEFQVEDRWIPAIIAWKKYTVIAQG